MAIRRGTLILLGVFILLVVAVVVWTRSASQNKPVVPTPTPSQMLINSAYREFISVELVDTKGTTVLLKKANNQIWMVEKPDPGTANQDWAIDVINQFSALTVMSTFESPPPPEATGLQQPVRIVTLTDTGGAGVVIKIGNTTATGSGYYVQVDQGSTVLVDKNSLDSALDVLSRMRAVTPTPEITLQPTAAEQPPTETPKP
jgi:hypothetical protein